MTYQRKDGKTLVPVYIDKSIYREIKVYAARTDQEIQEVIKSLNDDFEQAAIRKVSEIRELDKQADEVQKKEAEIQKISLENPLKVSGKLEDPIGSLDSHAN